MGYTKPYTYTDNTVLDVTNQSNNEESLRKYVNQEVVVTDIPNATFVGESIATPRIVSTVNTIDFVTKTIQGHNKIRLPQNFAYFTSTTKSDGQASYTLFDYQAIPNSGFEVNIQTANTKIMIVAYFKIYSDNNIHTPPRGAGNGRFDSNLVLQKEIGGITTQFLGTKNYVFEQSGSPSGSTPDAGASDESGNNRSIMITRMFSLAVGLYRFNFAVNPRVEKGFVNCQSVTFETFHI